MTVFKGEGSLCNVMGQTKAEFIDGEIRTEDPEVISFLMGKGYVPEPEVKATKKGVTNGV